MLGTLAKDFFEFAKVIVLFAKVSRKLDIINHCISCKGLPPPAARGSGRRRVVGLVLVQFTVWRCTPDIYLPFIASKSEASPQPNAMVMNRILAPAAGTA